MARRVWRAAQLPAPQRPGGSAAQRGPPARPWSHRTSLPLLPLRRRLRATAPGERLFLSVGCSHPELGDFFLATFDARLSAAPHLPNETASLRTLWRCAAAAAGAGAVPEGPARGAGGCRLCALAGRCSSGRRRAGAAVTAAATAASALSSMRPPPVDARRYGFQPHRVALWIYWHAVLLLAKGVPFYG